MNEWELTPVSTNENLRTELAETYRELDRLGLIFLAAGNISARHELEMLISPTGASAETIEEESFVLTKLSGEYVGDHRPSSEWSMHAAIYSAYPQANAVVHTHSDHCVALACTNEALPPFHYMIAAFGGGDVRCTPYITYATEELGEAAVSALDGRSACLLGNHGMICYGSTLQRALNSAYRLEVLCRQFIYARQAGPIAMLESKDLEIAIERYKTYGMI